MNPWDGGGAGLGGGLLPHPGGQVNPMALVGNLLGSLMQQQNMGGMGQVSNCLGIFQQKFALRMYKVPYSAGLGRAREGRSRSEPGVLAPWSRSRSR